jgi:dihydroorotate dehydrogenase
MYPLLRSLLFSLDAETSHEVTMAALRLYGALPGFQPGASQAGRETARQLMGMEFAHPVGLAAGLDKDARAVEGLARLGFSFIEVGTVTPQPQPGNPRPRLFRLPEASALINRMGFNNLGMLEMSRRLEALRRRDRLGSTRVGINVGKNKDTPLDVAAADYTACMETLYPYADYLTLNLSSPNTPGLRTLQAGDALATLLERIKDCQAKLAQQHGRRVPVLLKVAPDLALEDLETIARQLVAFEIDGVIATNTTISRPGLQSHPLASEAGGLSGSPLLPLALDVVGQLRQLLGPDVPLIGVGGIMDAEDGRTMLARGADLLQIYTGLIYRGPALVRALSRL